MNISRFLTMLALAGAVTLMTTSALAKERTKGRGAPGMPVIYVTSQDLYFDTLLLGGLPYNGTENFQLLKWMDQQECKQNSGPPIPIISVVAGGLMQTRTASWMRMMSFSCVRCLVRADLNPETTLFTNQGQVRLFKDELRDRIHLEMFPVPLFYCL